MQPSFIAQGAKRYKRLTGKSARVDYYKGTRQAYLPGSSLRTGPPGKHIINGTGKYQLDDTKVRYYVAPPIELLNKSTLMPFVYNPLPRHLDPNSSPKPPSPQLKTYQPSFSPTLLPSIPLDGTSFPLRTPEFPLQSITATSDSSSKTSLTPEERALRRQTQKDQREFEREYRALTEEQRMGLIMKSRREWWEGMVARTQAGRVGEGQREVEEGQGQ